MFFADYEGTLLGDCWHGFEAIAVGSAGRIVRAACNSHARRKFENSTSYPAERVQWMGWYQQLYDIEDRGKQMSVEERLALREGEAKPIWDAMEAWLEEVKQRTTHVILPKSDFAKALQYVRNHFIELTRYLEDGRLPIDNNETEQLMKQVALGRKNWLFVGSVEGGERAAGFVTLVSSALRNDLDVWIYVKDVLDQLLAGGRTTNRCSPGTGLRPTPTRSARIASKNVVTASIAARPGAPTDGTRRKPPSDGSHLTSLPPNRFPPNRSDPARQHRSRYGAGVRLPFAIR